MLIIKCRLLNRDYIYTCIKKLHKTEIRWLSHVELITKLLINEELRIMNNHLWKNLTSLFVCFSLIEPRKCFILREYTILASFVYRFHDFFKNLQKPFVHFWKGALQTKLSTCIIWGHYTRSSSCLKHKINPDLSKII